jgi:hypothetical protein
MLVAFRFHRTAKGIWEKQPMENSNLYCPNCHRTTYFFDCRTHLECSRCKKILIKVVPSSRSDASATENRSGL